MTQYKISLDSIATQSSIAELTAKFGDLTPVMGSIGEYMLGRVRDRFDSETSPSGSKWALLAESTIKNKQRRQKSGTTRNGKSRVRTNAEPSAILKDTFLLRDTMTYNPSPFSVAIGTPQKYGIYHQYGTARMPKREFLGYNDADLKEIQEIVVDALTI